MATYKPIFYRTLFENSTTFVNDLLFDTDTANSFKIICSKRSKTNFLTWVGLRSITPKNQGKHSFRNFFVGNDRGQRLWCVNLVLFTNTKLDLRG